MKDFSTEFSGISGLGAGVMVDTADGPIPVDWLRRGDRVLTRDRGYQKVLWAGRTRDCTLPLPVRLLPDALGPRCPDHALVLAPGHRVLLRAPQVELNFGTTEVFANASDVALASELWAGDVPADFAYYHLLLDGHHAILAEGIWIESLFPDAATLGALGPQAEAEIRAAAPDLDHWQTARMCLTPHESLVMQPRAAILAERMAA